MNRAAKNNAELSDKRVNVERNEVADAGGSHRLQKAAERMIARISRRLSSLADREGSAAVRLSEHVSEISSTPVKHTEHRPS